MIFDVIFEILFTTIGFIIGKTIIPIITFGKFRVLNSQIEKRIKGVNKTQNKWYGTKILNVYYLNIEITGLVGLLILSGIVFLILITV